MPFKIFHDLLCHPIAIHCIHKHALTQQHQTNIYTVHFLKGNQKKNVIQNVLWARDSVSRSFKTNGSKWLKWDETKHCISHTGSIRFQRYHCIFKYLWLSNSTIHCTANNKCAFVICYNFNMPASICTKFGKWKQQTQSHKTHTVILKFCLP